MQWEYRQPVVIHFGNGKLAQLSDEIDALGGTRALLVTSEGFVKRHVVSAIVDDCEGGIAAVYPDVKPNAPYQECQACVDLIKEKDCDIVVALGGGSVMDTAKAAACICTGTRTVRSFLGHADELPGKGLPVIAIPTTAGTASEVTRVSVLSDPQEHVKYSMHNDALFADVALVDPELTYTLPKHATASTGMDVLCHALEGYWSVNHQPITDTMAFGSLKRVFKYLHIACRDPENAEAREGMAEASILAGLTFALPGTTGPHACSYPITSLFDIDHGEACGMTIVDFLYLNAVADEDGRIIKLARRLGFGNIDEMANRIIELKVQAGLLQNLKGFSPTKEQIDRMVADSKNSTLLRNPVKVTDEDLYRIFEGLC